jgi:hypothetical protein
VAKLTARKKEILRLVTEGCWREEGLELTSHAPLTQPHLTLFPIISAFFCVMHPRAPFPRPR